jgi:hypothetical protein
MSKVVKMIKEGASSLARTAKGVLKGDVNDILNVATLGGSKTVEKLGQAIHKPFKAPDPLPMPGLGQANTEEAAPDVDITSTESVRRRSGSAVGTRKLRVPLGGLK